MTLDLDWIAELAGARSAVRGERVQSLWSGYGEIVRVRLRSADVPSVIVKWVRPPEAPRDPAARRSHARKLRSYEVERAWYVEHARRADGACRVARMFGGRTTRGEQLLVLEDLDAAGFDGRQSGRGTAEVERCLSWLAAFHARQIGAEPSGLWRRGTYWHLATRPDELARTDDAALRAAAPVLEARLAAARFKTIVHGDAKLANFCFGRTGVAAVDFQYAGGGSGMEDVAYLLWGSPRPAEASHLDRYFAELRRRLPAGIDGEALEAEWRALYPIALADFGRFLAGWAKDHWARDTVARARVAEVLGRL